jgi:hypothetical protein
MYQRAADQMAAADSNEPKLKSKNSAFPNTGQKLNTDRPTHTPSTKHDRHSGNIHITGSVTGNIRHGLRSVPTRFRQVKQQS